MPPPEALHARDRFSLGAMLAGWVVAALLSAVASQLVLHALAAWRGSAAGDAVLVSWPMVTLVLAGVFGGHVAGGYAAGRIAGARGAAHGLALLAMTTLAVLAGAATFLGRGGSTSLFVVGLAPADVILAVAAAAVATVGVAGAGAILGARAGAAARGKRISILKPGSHT